jgi:hypothetical protein
VEGRSEEACMQVQMAHRTLATPASTLFAGVTVAIGGPTC